MLTTRSAAVAEVSIAMRIETAGAPDEVVDTPSPYILGA